jgi:hypothetical protein
MAVVEGCSTCMHESEEDKTIWTKHCGLAPAARWARGDRARTRAVLALLPPQPIPDVNLSRVCVPANNPVSLRRATELWSDLFFSRVDEKSYFTSEQSDHPFPATACPPSMFCIYFCPLLRCSPTWKEKLPWICKHALFATWICT